MERVTVPDAPAGSALQRGLTTALNVALSVTGLGGPDGEHPMTVCVTHTDGESEYAVFSAAAIAYTEREAVLESLLAERGER